MAPINRERQIEMKGKNFSNITQRLKYVGSDLVMTALAFFLFNVFRFDVMHLIDKGYSSLWDFIFSPNVVTEQIAIPVCSLGVYWLSGYYNKPFLKSRLSEFGTTLYSALSITVLVYLLFLINDSSGFRRKDYEVILVLFGLLLGLLYVGRCFITNFTLRKLRLRKWRFCTLIVGNSSISREVCHRLKDSGSVWSYDVVGFIKIDGEHQVCDAEKVWEMSEIKDVCLQHKVDQIILAPEKIRDADVMRVLKDLFPLNVPVRIAPDTLSYITSNIRMSDILGIPFIDLTSPRIGEFEKNVKRTFDVIVSSLALLVLLPFLAVIAAVIKATSRGPVIYSQERLGHNRKPFRIYKFRSMRCDAEHSGPQLSSSSDPRITPFGRILRKYRIDEIPQFWNVLRGDMSIVGPRPEREFYINQIVKRAPYYGLIFQVRPGITSWGMVKYGYASDVDQMVERSQYDLIYINNMSIMTDMKIIIYTVRTVVCGKGM